MQDGRKICANCYTAGLRCTTNVLLKNKELQAENNNLRAENKIFRYLAKSADQIIQKMKTLEEYIKKHKELIWSD